MDRHQCRIQRSRKPPNNDFKGVSYFDWKCQSSYVVQYQKPTKKFFFNFWDFLLALWCSSETKMFHTLRPMGRIQLLLPIPFSNYDVMGIFSQYTFKHLSLFLKDINSNSPSFHYIKDRTLDCNGAITIHWRNLITNISLQLNGFSPILYKRQHWDFLIKCYNHLMLAFWSRIEYNVKCELQLKVWCNFIK